jgi:hypothetical protein
MTVPPNAETVGHQHQWSEWTTGMVAQHRYCLCGDAETRPLPPTADSALARAVRMWMATVYGAVSDEQLDFICNTDSYFTLQEALAHSDSSGAEP